ncbi:MAG TPA: Gfo/Idh/MocA family oxidoreductase [Clostridia bacterium]|nr:Gfo/Idh/MocA family oxidoreductase [Clostridia bacterium]
MKTLRTAVAGLGRIGWEFHLPSVAAHAGFDLVAVCDALPERLDEACTRYPAAGYADFDEMLERERPDLVVIATPTHLHVQHAVAAMERGCDVFLDKPIGRDLAEADRILDARKRTGQKLMLFQPRRADAEIQVLREILQSGLIGDVYMIKMARVGFVFRSDWQAFAKFGGGMLNNYGAHMIDTALYLAGSTARRTDAHLYTIASAGDAEDVVKILIETENRITLDIDINMACALELPRAMAFGSCGTIALMDGAHGQYCHARYFDPKRQQKAVASEAPAAAGRKYVTAQPAEWQEQNFPICAEKGIDYYEKCYDYFALDAAPFVPLAETREVMRVVDACKKASESGNITTG